MPSSDPDTSMIPLTPTLPRVLVALGINPNSQRLIEAAARLASSIGGELLALHIAPVTSTPLYKANLQRHVEHAEALGARVEIVQSRDVATALVRFGTREHVSYLVVGQSDVSRWREITRGSVINRLLRIMLQEDAPFDLYVVTASSRF